MIEFTEHAKEKLLERKLKKKWIIETVTSPEFSISSYGKRRIAHKKIGKLYLAVIFVKESGKTVIITVHWDKGFKPPVIN